MFSPVYSITNDALNFISAIEQLTSTLSQIHIPPALLDHIRKQCIAALTHFSTEIEGNKLSLPEVSGVIEHDRTYGMKRDEKEVANYFKLLEEIPVLIKRYNGKIESGLILQCHKMILKGIVERNLCGRFRDIQNAIYESGTSRLAYLPPEANDVIPLMDELCEWINNSTVHPIVAAAIFHNQFVTIHPFVDGNGRLARMISLYYLDSHGYEWKRIVPIDRYYADDRGRYYDALQGNYAHNYYEGRSKADFTSWIEYYLEGIESVLKDTIDKIELQRHENILMNGRQEKILVILSRKGYITASEYAKRFNISSRMAARDLKQLVSWNRLIVVGKARSTKYTLK